jgi:hypothetical protein
MMAGGEGEKRPREDKGGVKEETKEASGGSSGRRLEDCMLRKGVGRRSRRS